MDEAFEPFIIMFEEGRLNLGVISFAHLSFVVLMLLLPIVFESSELCNMTIEHFCLPLFIIYIYQCFQYTYQTVSNYIASVFRNRRGEK